MRMNHVVSAEWFFIEDVFFRSHVKSKFLLIVQIFAQTLIWFVRFQCRMSIQIRIKNLSAMFAAQHGITGDKSQRNLECTYHTSCGKKGACKLTQIALPKSARPIMISVNHWRLVNFGNKLRILTLSMYLSLALVCVRVLFLVPCVHNLFARFTKITFNLVTVCSNRFRL